MLSCMMRLTWAEVARIKTRESAFVMSLWAQVVHTVYIMLIWLFH